MNYATLLVLGYVVCSVLIAGYLFMQIPSVEVSGCTQSTDDLERERMARVTCPAFLVLCMMAVLNGIFLLGAWAVVRVGRRRA